MTSAHSTVPSSSSAAASGAAAKKGLPLALKIVLGLAFVIGVLAIIVALQPSEFHIARTLKMAAPADKVFAQVNDFHKWDAWSPWIKIDPNAKATFEGPESGEGAVFRWAGNAEVGEGSMTILESKPPESVKIKLHFLKPFEDTAKTQFTLKPEGDQTAVTWSMDGKNNFIGKIFCLLIMDMEKMIGGKYEEGLAKIKAIVEAPTSAKPQSEDPKPTDEETKAKAETKPKDA